MKMKILLVALLFLPILTAGTACAGWLIYNKPAFQGQILDTATKQGIEGAAVVALYYTGRPGIAGAGETVVHVRETFTDKEGKFRLPSYTTIISPFSWADGVRFIIWKPGYVGIFTGLEAHFSGGESLHPEVDTPWRHNPELIIRYRQPNIVELPPTRSREDRLRAIPSPYLEVRTWDRQRYLIQLIREEEAALLGRRP